jgi:hypothetical protein
MEQIIKRGLGGEVRARFRENGLIVTEINDVSVEIYGPDGELMGTQMPCTIEADGTMVAYIDAIQCRQVRDWCRARFYFSVNGKHHSLDRHFHIAESTFEIPFFEKDLLLHAPFLRVRKGDHAAEWDDMRRAAVSLIYSRLSNAGRKPWKIVNLSSLDSVLAALWISIICESLSANPDDIWSARNREYRTNYETEFARLNLVESEDGRLNNPGGAGRPMFRSKIRRA